MNGARVSTSHSPRTAQIHGPPFTSLEISNQCSLTTDPSQQRGVGFWGLMVKRERRSCTQPSASQASHPPWDAEGNAAGRHQP